MKSERILGNVKTKGSTKTWDSKKVRAYYMLVPSFIFQLQRFTNTLLHHTQNEVLASFELELLIRTTEKLLSNAQPEAN